MKAEPTRFFNALSWLTGIIVSIGLLVMLRHIRIPFFLYYPRTTDTVLISESLDRYLFLVVSLCVPGTSLAMRDNWRTRIRSEAFVTSALWLAGIILLPINVSYGISIIYLAVIILAIAVLMKRLETIERRTSVAYLVVGAMTIVALIECASIYYWMTSAASPLGLFGFASQKLEVNLTYSAYPITPILLLIAMFSWIWVPIMGRGGRVLHASGNSKPDGQANIPEHSVGMNGRLLIASLSSLVIVSVLVFYFPYAAGQAWIVGRDSYWRYLNPLNSLTGPLPQAIFASLKQYHGVYVGLLYTIERGVALDSFTIVKFAPLILAVCTSSFLFLAFRRSRSHWLAVMVGLCALLWLPTTLGMFGGIQANWMADALWMLFLAFYLNGSGKFRPVNFVAQSLLSIGILMLHPWTWGVFLATVVLAALFAAQHLRDFRAAITAMFSAMWIAIPVGAVVFAYLPGVGSDMANAFSLYTLPLLHANLLLKFQGAWLEMLRDWSSFLSPTLIIIAIVGAFAVNEFEGVTKRYMLAWVATWCIGSFLVASIGYNPARPATSETQLWRMLYVSPLPILLAMGTKRLVDLSKRLEISISTKFTWVQPALSVMITCATSLPLFVFTSPAVRLVSIVAGSLGILVLTTRFRANSLARIMLIIVLTLIIVNAAFRSLFPLLIDPQSLNK